MGTDRERFEELFGRHYGALMRYAVRRVGTDTANEIVSETFLTAWRRLDAVPDNALPWLYGTARRLVANELRRRHRQLRLDERIATNTDTTSPDHADVVTDRLRVRAALADLSERDREVLRLAEWERLDAADGAKVLGCTQAAFKVRLHRARRRLAARLGANDTALSELIVQGESS